MEKNDYDSAVEFSSKYAKDYSNRGSAKTKSGDYTGAIEDFNTAIKLDPKLALTYYNRGLVKYKLGDKKGAIEDLNIAGKLGYKKAYEKIQESKGSKVKGEING